MIFVISDTLEKAEKILPETFVGLNIWERTHIEEWVRLNPDILGEDLLILTVEFDRFTQSTDRLDILALDVAGNLVIIELKRDSVSGYADLQAIRYAAMISSMTIGKLVPYYVAYRKKHYNETVAEGDARDQIIDFVESEGFVEFSTKPRIILCSEGFSQEITTTVLWLRSFQIDISCVKMTPYRVAGKIIIVPKVMIPLEEAKQYLIDIKVKEEEREQSGGGTSRARNTMNVLLENGLVKAGDTVYLKNALPAYIVYGDGDLIFQATITGKVGQSAIRWAKDGKEYSLTALAKIIFRDLHPENRVTQALNGALFWATADGRSLAQVAEDFVKASSLT
jgi:hypothetical protein